MSEGAFPLSTEERARYGATVTARERTTGALELIVVSDQPPRQATREIARRIDELEGEWEVAAYSTPGTIWRDLQGLRALHEGWPEETAFGGIGRLDLVPIRPGARRTR